MTGMVAAVVPRHVLNGTTAKLNATKLPRDQRRRSDLAAARPDSSPQGDY